MLTVELLRRTNVALVVLAGVACTKIIGLPDLPEPGSGGASGRSGQSGGTGQIGGTSTSGGRSANGGAVSSGGSAATGGSTGDSGGEAGASSGTGGSALGGSSGAGGLMGAGGGSGGTVESGGSGGTGGSAGDGGRGPGGGSPGTGGNDVGGTSGTGGSTGGVTGGGMSGASGSGGTPPASDGPCDIYATASTPCVAAYSTIRRLKKSYTGPLYQVRSGSSAQNTGTGGIRHDIAMTADGFANASAQDAACAGSICTISLVYDQSGNNNHLSVAKKGSTSGSTYAGTDDFESIADAGELTVGGHTVYSLYMAKREGYRLAARGTGMPVDAEAQGLYLLADGSRVGDSCCWDFGNVSVDPTVFTSTNALFFGKGFWGKGNGEGPWFMADFATGIWAGGTNPGENGYGNFSNPGPPNTNNPSLLVPFALGFLKTDATKYALRMANAQSASTVTTAYQGNLPEDLDNQGGIVLGVGADNSNESFGTFYEGAILAGFPTDAAELDVLENIKAAGYGE